MKTNIRTKLIISLLSVVLLIGIGSMVFSLFLINKNIVGQAFDDVQIQLNMARYVYNEKINIINMIIRHVSMLDYVQEAVYFENKNLLYKKLQETKKELDLDIINITDANGKIICRENNPKVTGDDVGNSGFIRYVITNKKSCSGTDIIIKEQLENESGELTGQAHIKIVTTPKARQRNINEKAFEENGLVIVAAWPVFFKEKFIGIIYGAKLLNNNFELIDSIKNLVFKEEKLNGMDVGTATIFLNDLRISTNVKDKHGSRAIGTQVSEEVYSKVVEHEKIWLDKAFVVNDWYISAYEPIYSVYKRVIGILYVGILEEKYRLIIKNTTYYSIGMILITSLVAVFLSIYLIRTIIHPINSLVKASNEIASGNFNNKLEINTEDEMGYLCGTFNKMIDAIVERDKKLTEQTQMQIVKSEKLASLGRLASGIAHEINNPLTGVLSYGSSLLKDLKGTEYEEDLNVIVNETLRCREIVKGILDFARETRLEKHEVNLNKVIAEVMVILERHLNFQNIKIIKHLNSDIPNTRLDTNQIKSVINNLAVNASDAMPNGGELTISTRYNKAQNEIIMEIADNGTGISDDNLIKIFDPFFTTKETGRGTGLGLSVTYGIIKRHNGWIDVKSELGHGTRFIIGLPVEA